MPPKIVTISGERIIAPLEEAGQELGISREGRQVEGRALQRLRDDPEVKKLQDHLRSD